MTLQILCTLFCGLIIGLERELKNKNAGVKTTLFIMLASFIFCYIGSLTGDMARLISQIISGVGFVGSGVIIFNRDTVAGLTSAAIIWLSSAIGVLTALNRLTEAIGFSIIIIVLDLGIDFLKKRHK